MAYQTHFVFCATPFECDAELHTFQEALATFNRQEAMPNGYLFASLLLVPALTDKRPYQGAVNENIRMSSYYIQVIEDSWGPPQRDFERDWALAQRSLADPDLPMCDTVLLFKAPLLPHKVDPVIVELKREMLTPNDPHAAFDHPQQLREILNGLFSSWLATALAKTTPEQCLS